MHMLFDSLRISTETEVCERKGSKACCGLRGKVSSWLVQLVVQIHMATVLSTPPPRVDISEQSEEFKQSKVMSVELLMIQINIGVATLRFFGRAEVFGCASESERLSCQISVSAMPSTIDRPGLRGLVKPLESFSLEEQLWLDCGSIIELCHLKPQATRRSALPIRLGVLGIEADLDSDRAISGLLVQHEIYLGDFPTKL
jgi:hypothetical protein